MYSYDGTNRNASWLPLDSCIYHLGFARNGSPNKWHVVHCEAVEAHQLAQISLDWDCGLSMFAPPGTNGSQRFWTTRGERCDRKSQRDDRSGLE